MDRQLLAYWRDRYRALRTGPTERCPEVERLAALVLGEVEDAGREELADHVVSCAHCSDGFRALLQLHEAASEE